MKKIIGRTVLGLLVLAVLLFFFTRGPRSLFGPLAELQRAAGDVHYAKLALAGDLLQSGIYDPSVAYSPDGRVGWLAYTSIDGDYKPVGQFTHTHLARTTNNGASWQFVKVLNASTNATLTTDDGKTLDGAWRYEVATLVCDPTDPDAARRWKILTHCYFWSPKVDRLVQYGWVDLRTASDPAGDWSPHIPLFGAGKFPLGANHKTLIDLNTLDASLRNTIAYSEPGLLAHDDKLYLGITALQPHPLGPRHTIVLLASADHGHTWRFINTLLTHDDATKLGCADFDGSSLAEDAGRLFLLASPMRRGKVPEVHEGTAVFEFESLAEGRLRRDAKQLPAIVNYFAPQPDIFSIVGAGQSTYDSHNTNGGLIMPQFNVKAYPEVFQIFQTGRKIVTRR